MKEWPPADAKREIERSIQNSGCHIYVVGGGGPLPRFVYSIGFTESIGYELILEGASFYKAVRCTLGSCS